MTLYRKKRVGVDLDGVICDHVAPLLPKLRVLSKSKLNKEDIIMWDLPLGMTSLSEEIEKAFTQREFLLNLPIIEGAKEALERISNLCDVIIVTSRKESYADETKEWLMKNQMNYPVFFTNKKNEVDIDILIDDKIEYVAEFASKERLGVLFSQPWNTDRQRIKHLVDSGKVIVHSEWKEVARAIKQTFDKPALVKLECV